MTNQPATDTLLLIEIAVILVLKLFLLFIIWYYFFNDAVPITATEIENTLFSNTKGTLP